MKNYISVLLFGLLPFFVFSQGKTLHLKADGHTQGNGYTGTLVMQYAFAKCYDEFVVGFNFSYSSFHPTGYRYNGRSYSFSEFGLSTPSPDYGVIKFTAKVINGSKTVGTITCNYVTPNGGGCYGDTYTVVKGDMAATLEQAKNNLTIVVTSVQSLGGNNPKMERLIDEKATTQTSETGANNNQNTSTPANDTPPAPSFNYEVTAIVSRGKVTKIPAQQDYYNNRQAYQRESYSANVHNQQSQHTTRTIAANTPRNASSHQDSYNQQRQEAHRRQIQQQNDAILNQAKANAAAVQQGIENLGDQIANNMIAARNERLEKQRLDELKAQQEREMREAQQRQEAAERAEQYRIDENYSNAASGLRTYNSNLEQVEAVVTTLDNDKKRLTQIADAKKMIAFGWFVTASYITYPEAFDQPTAYNEASDSFTYKNAEILDIDITEPIKLSRTANGWESPGGFNTAMQAVHQNRTYFCYGPFEYKKDAEAFLQSITPNANLVDYRLHQISFSNAAPQATTDLLGNQVNSTTEDTSQVKRDMLGNPIKPKTKNSQTVRRDLFGNPIQD